MTGYLDQKVVGSGQASFRSPHFDALTTGTDNGDMQDQRSWAMTTKHDMMARVVGASAPRGAFGGPRSCRGSRFQPEESLRVQHSFVLVGLRSVNCRLQHVGLHLIIYVVQDDMGWDIVEHRQLSHLFQQPRRAPLICGPPEYGWLHWSLDGQ
uniref:Uncharacterized protein n=2 Tax=Oryza TaxID=4527 RepID=A0A0D3ENV1_9ORYZ